MARLKGMYATNAHIFLMIEGWHLDSSSLNDAVIYNVYTKDASTLVLLISRSTHNIEEVVE